MLLISWRHCVRRRLQLGITDASQRQPDVPVTKQVSQGIKQAFLIELGRMRGVTRDEAVWACDTYEPAL